MGKEKIVVFRERGKLYVAKESAYNEYIRRKHLVIRCDGFETPIDVINYLTCDSDLTTSDFIVK